MVPEHGQGVVVAFETDEGVVKLDRGRQVFQPFDHLPIPGLGHGIEVTVQLAVDPLARPAIQRLPDHAAHDGVEVIAVGRFVPADEPAVFQLGQHGIERPLVRAGLVRAREEGAQRLPAGRHAEGGEGVEHPALRVAESSAGRIPARGSWRS